MSSQKYSRKAVISDYITVVLSEHQVNYATATGVMRFEESRLLGLKSTTANTQIDITGAKAELAFAIGMGLRRQLTLNTFKRPDVVKWQVRSTNHPRGSLIIRPRDPLNEPYALVRGSDATWQIIGWMWGHEAAQSGYAANPGGRGSCWFVPASELHPMSESPWPEGDTITQKELQELLHTFDKFREAASELNNSEQRLLDILRQISKNRVIMDLVLAQHFE